MTKGTRMGAFAFACGMPVYNDAAALTDDFRS